MRAKSSSGTTLVLLFVALFIPSGTYSGGYRSTECSLLLCLAIPMPITLQNATYRSCSRCWHSRLWRQSPHLSVVALEDGTQTWEWRPQSFLFAGFELTFFGRYDISGFRSLISRSLRNGQAWWVGRSYRVGSARKPPCGAPPLSR